MRKLLNTLFVLSEDSYLSLDGENVVVLRGDETLGRFPLHTLESILCFSYKGASPALMGACGKRGVTLSFLTPRGRFLATASGTVSGNVLLRRTQYRLADDPIPCAQLARQFVLGKVYNARWVLERATRDHPLQVDVPRLKEVSASLSNQLPAIAACQNTGELRGLEGACATAYFGVFDQLILQAKDAFYFHARSRRPPLDRLNALLSFCYSLLAGDCTSALAAVGLDPYVGYLHTDRPGRASLSMDLMEELRPTIADRFAVTCVNRRILSPEQFDCQENGATFLNEGGRKAVLTAWQNRKKEVLLHPFLHEKVPWGLVPYTQALLLSRTLRGDMDLYPPFFWK